MRGPGAGSCRAYLTTGSPLAPPEADEECGQHSHRDETAESHDPCRHQGIPPGGRIEMITEKEETIPQAAEVALGRLDEREAEVSFREAIAEQRERQLALRREQERARRVDELPLAVGAIAEADGVRELADAGVVPRLDDEEIPSF